MKKAIAKALVVSVLAILISQTAVYGEKRIEFGVKAGYNFASHWSTEEKPDDSSVIIRSQFGLLAGTMADIRLSGLFRLQPEILYVQKGSIQEVAAPGVPIGYVTVVYDLQYLEIPLLLKLYPRKGKGLVQPVLSSGGYFSYLLKGSYSFSNPFIGSMDFDMEDLQKTDFGFLGGLGIEFQEETLTFGIQYRYSMGFVDLDLPTGPGAPTVALRNFSHMISFEIFF
jgi:hypothetical protein